MSEDVVIAGGGPNGLMLACELSLAGARPLVLERLPELTERNRANGMVGQVVRLLDHRGLYERMTGTVEPPRPVPSFIFGALPMQLQDLPDTRCTRCRCRSGRWRKSWSNARPSSGCGSGGDTS